MTVILHTRYILIVYILKLDILGERQILDLETCYKISTILRRSCIPPWNLYAMYDLYELYDTASLNDLQ